MQMGRCSRGEDTRWLCGELEDAPAAVISFESCSDNIYLDSIANGSPGLSVELSILRLITRRSKVRSSLEAEEMK